MFKTSARRSRRDAQEKDDRKRPRFGAGMAVRAYRSEMPPVMEYCSEMPPVMAYCSEMRPGIRVQFKK